MIEGKNIIVETQRKARGGFGRFLVTLYTNEKKNSNKEMVRQGYAWYYNKSPADSSYQNLQEEAKSLRKGLWQAPNPIPPWKFRKKK